MESGIAQNTRRPISVVMSPRTTSRCGQRILKTLDSSTSAKTGSPTSPSVTSHVRVQRGSWFHGHTTMWALRTITNYWLQALGLLQRLDTSSWLIQSLANIMIFGNSTCAGMRWMLFITLFSVWSIAQLISLWTSRMDILHGGSMVSDFLEVGHQVGALNHLMPSVGDIFIFQIYCSFVIILWIWAFSCGSCWIYRNVCNLLKNIRSSTSLGSIVELLLHNIWINMPKCWCWEIYLMLLVDKPIAHCLT